MKQTEEEQSYNARRSGRGKNKASTPLESASKKPRLVVSQETNQPTTTPSADSEVAGIFGGTDLGSGIPGYAELMATESKKKVILLILENGMPFMNFIAVFGPLMRLSPPPSEKDYCFNLDDSEGACDLFDAL